MQLFYEPAVLLELVVRFLQLHPRALLARKLASIAAEIYMKGGDCMKCFSVYDETLIQEGIHVAGEEDSAQSIWLGWDYDQRFGRKEVEIFLDPHSERDFIKRRRIYEADVVAVRESDRVDHKIFVPMGIGPENEVLVLWQVCREYFFGYGKDGIIIKPSQPTPFAHVLGVAWTFAQCPIKMALGNDFTSDTHTIRILCVLREPDFDSLKKRLVGPRIPPRQFPSVSMIGSGVRGLDLELKLMYDAEGDTPLRVAASYTRKPKK